MKYFTSDLHFGHKRIIDHCHRPFKSVDDMDAEIVRRWNERVTDNDEVYVLGDVSFHGSIKTQAILEQLKGHKHLIRGNHDTRPDHFFSRFFATVKDYHTIQEPDSQDGIPIFQTIVMSHFPFMSWWNMQHGSWHLHGHCHGSLEVHPDDTNRRIDVGVDCWNFYPVSYTEIGHVMRTKKFCRIDHHREKRSDACQPQK